jgi:hypothetical protein
LYEKKLGSKPVVALAMVEVVAKVDCTHEHVLNEIHQERLDKDDVQWAPSLDPNLFLLVLDVLNRHFLLPCPYHHETSENHEKQHPMS